MQLQYKFMLQTAPVQIMKSTIQKHSNPKASVFHQKELFLPKNRVNYYIYKPVIRPNAAFYEKIFDSLNLAYYKYLLATGLYMMNERERFVINFLVVASTLLGFYHFIF